MFIEESFHADEKFMADFVPAVIDTLPFPFLVITPDYRVVLANEFARKVHDFGEVGSVTCHQLTHRRDEPCSGEDHPCPLREIERTGGPVVLEHQHYDGQGAEQIVQVHGVPSFDAEGELEYIIEMCLDITGQRRAERELAREKERLAITCRSIGDGVIATDRRRRVTMMNPVAENLTGWAEEEAEGRPFAEVFRIVNEHSREPCEDPVRRVLREGRVVGLANHTVLLRRDGVERSIADSAAPIADEEGQVHGAVIVFRDVTDEREKERQLEYLSFHDELTGLYSRTYLEEELLRLHAEEQLPLSIVMGDTNGLKLVNDAFGHQVGDDTLQRIGRIIRENCRREDVACRWGGDEFAILFPRTDAAQVERICSRMQEAVDSAARQPVPLSLSLGAATMTSASENPQDRIAEAEERMYRNKMLERESFHSAVLRSLQRMLWEKTYETEEHCLRLQELVTRMGEALELPANELDDLMLLASLHDIGKVAISNGILGKKESLDAEDWRVIRSHPETGARIVESIPHLASIAELILSHHERWDGTGYPHGLAGQDIPRASRILAVVDAYDAMTQERPYRATVTHEEALAELRRNAGTQFDPQMVELFCRIMRDG